MITNQNYRDNYDRIFGGGSSDKPKEVIDEVPHVSNRDSVDDDSLSDAQDVVEEIFLSRSALEENACQCELCKSGKGHG